MTVTSSTIARRVSIVSLNVREVAVIRCATVWTVASIATVATMTVATMTVVTVTWLTVSSVSKSWISVEGRDTIRSISFVSRVRWDMAVTVSAIRIA